jgi:lipoprotein-anchoring transpeptidase ErfK/SrfK
MSRGLIGLLGVTIVLGLVFYLHNVSKSSAKENPGKTNAPVSLPPPSQGQSPKVATNIGPARATDPVAIPATNPSTQPTNRPANRMLSGPSGSDLLASKSALADASAKQTAGDLLGARRVLNAALQTGSLSDADSDAAKKMMRDINQTVVFSPKRFADDEFGGTYTVQTGDLLRKIADKHEITWELLARLNGLSDPKKLRAGAAIKVMNGPYNAVVSKSKFTIDIYLGPPGEKGSMYVTTFPVGLGRDDSTPTGTWMVESQKKIKNPTYFSPRGEGVVAADDPKNPLGERWIGLTGVDGHAVGKQSYGIHGTIDPDSIGKQASMGCIRLRNEDVEWVFDLLVEGKSIVVVKD